MSEKEAIEILKNNEMYITDSFYREFRTTIADKYTKAFETVLNLIEKQQAEIETLKETDKKRTWTVNKVICEYVPDYKLVSLVNRYKNESFIPRVEVEKILNDSKIEKGE